MSKIHQPCDLFETFVPLNNHQRVTIANGDSVDSLGQGTIRVESCVKGKAQTCSDTSIVRPKNKKKMCSQLCLCKIKIQKVCVTT